MTYWQELRREWLESAAIGGVVSWLCSVFILTADKEGMLIEYAVSFMFVWPVMFIVDIFVVLLFRMIRK